MEKSAVATPELYSVTGACAVLQCGRSTIYKLIGQRKLIAVKLLGSTKITAASICALVADVPPAKIKVPSLVDHKPFQRGQSARRSSVRA